MALSKILVPLDGSNLAEKALPIATALARQSEATICLAAVTGRAEGDRRHTESQAYLTGVSESLLARDYMTGVRVGSGPVAQGIVEIARDEDADLIVMTTHGRSGIARTALGSVTDAVVLDAPAPVYITRSETATQRVRLDGLASGIIVPLDGSELAETALDHAIMLARACQAPLQLLRVVDEVASLTEKDQAYMYLEHVAGRLAEQDIEPVVEVLAGDPAQSIANAMTGQPDSVVVLTTRGASGFVRWRRGSVADWLVRRAPGPIVVVPPNKQALLGLAIH